MNGTHAKKMFGAAQAVKAFIGIENLNLKHQNKRKLDYGRQTISGF